MMHLIAIVCTGAVGFTLGRYLRRRRDALKAARALAERPAKKRGKK